MAEVGAERLLREPQPAQSRRARLRRRGRGAAAGHSGSPAQQGKPSRTVPRRRHLQGLLRRLRSAQHDPTAVLARIPGPGPRAGCWELTRRDFSSLRQGEYVTDNVINAYLHLVEEAAAAQGRRVRCVSSQLPVRLCSNQGYDFHAVRRWTRHAPIVGMDLLLFPMHVGLGDHWALAALDLRAGAATWYDPLGKPPDTERLGLLRQWVQDEHCARGAPAPSVDDSGPELAPRQENPFDCGIFILLAACCLAAGRRAGFSQVDATRWRDKISLQLRARKMRLSYCTALYARQMQSQQRAASPSSTEGVLL
eukprot:TRINITY_DN66210_c0_g1_i1.p1 TRINITY_DN66210_c0_g1~~TRINITY_DN66210_c0_g1_i1.p1  ORF type:complete len:330 (+),score=36.31 TRINITY_DN66210_c0_g1_i1:65-991(+)